jgi:hypothetical protein
MTATIYCKFMEFYWFAWCPLPDGASYNSENKTHGSARQAADEVLARMRADLGQGVTMRRLSIKVYEVTVPEAQ